MPKRPSKSRASKKEDEYTPEKRRKIDAQLDISEAQGKAGLSFGPHDSAATPLTSLLKARKHTRHLSIDIPAVLLSYLEQEAKRFGMTARHLIVTILETHRFADSDQQLITLAIAHLKTEAKKRNKTTKAISESTKDFKTGRYQDPEE